MQNIDQRGKVGHFDFQGAMWELTMLLESTVAIKSYYNLLFMYKARNIYRCVIYLSTNDFLPTICEIYHTHIRVKYILGYCVLPQFGELWIYFHQFDYRVFLAIWVNMVVN